jgi:hypothetical protein
MLLVTYSSVFVVSAVGSGPAQANKQEHTFPIVGKFFFFLVFL